MQIQNQVCSLESAKKLKELGINNPSLWLHIYPNEGMINSRANIAFHTQESFYLEDNDNDEHDLFSAHAYTSSELGEMLPREIKIMRIGYNDWVQLRIIKLEDTWRVSYWDGLMDNEYIKFTHINLAEAMALMVIYLIKIEGMTASQLMASINKEGE